MQQVEFYLLSDKYKIVSEKLQFTGKALEYFI